VHGVLVRVFQWHPIRGSDLEQASPAIVAHR
jgi:hypothetical protein